MAGTLCELYTRTRFACSLLIILNRQDDLIIALQLAIIGCSKFWQDPKYRGFRANDYLTPQGLAEGPRMI